MVRSALSLGTMPCFRVGERLRYCGLTEQSRDEVGSAQTPGDARMTPYEARSLAAVILERAVKDWRSPTRCAEEAAALLGFGSLRAELEEFLAGDWCSHLLGGLSLPDVDLLECLEREAA